MGGKERTIRAAGKMPQTNRAADDTAGNASDNAARVARVKLWSDGFMGKEERKIEDIPQREVSVFDHRALLSLRYADSSLESSHIVDVHDELWGIPEREEGGGDSSLMPTLQSLH